MNSLPLVSILTPSFNQGRWLRTNLDSVRNQTYPNIEHVVMDGGSTDESLEVLSRAGSSVRWVSEPDRGQSHAINKAYKASSGEYIGWLNSDDAYVDRRSVESAIRVFESFPEVGVVYGHALLVNASDEVVQVMWAPPFLTSLFQYVNGFVQPAAFIRRSVLGDFVVDEHLDFVMDRDLWLRLAQKTTFRRVNLYTGLDRHQPLRKIHTSAYPIERDAYHSSRGKSPKSLKWKVVVKGSKILGRLPSAVRALRLPSEVEPAVDLVFPSKLRMVERTVAKRSMLPLG